jgi:hypothetical protein
MRTLSSAGVVDLWEHGARRHPLDRSLLALSVADPAAANDAADWPLGRRNAALLRLYSVWFGPQVQGWTSCPACSEKVEFDVDARQMAAAADGPAPGPVTVGEHAFRLPTTRDLAQMVAADDTESAAAGLLERCRIGGSATAEWSGALLTEIEDALASADPLAETRLAFRCPTCEHDWEDGFEIDRFLWVEVESWARRVLWEVHTLASAYGWTEAESLALGPARRAIYLQMVHA